MKGFVWHIKWLFASYALFVATFIVAGIGSLFVFNQDIFTLMHHPYFLVVALVATAVFGALIYKRLK